MLTILLNHLEDPKTALVEIRSLRDSEALKADASDPAHGIELARFCAEALLQFRGHGDEDSAAECRNIALQYVSIQDYEKIQQELQTPSAETAP